MKLEQQVQKLSDIGLTLNDDVSIDDMLYSFAREEYEKAPFELVLFVYGMEIERKPWGRYFCDRAWNFDVEAIEDNGSYVKIVNQFHRITGKAKKIENLQDNVDLGREFAELHYAVDGVEKTYSPKIVNDWADADVVSAIMADLSQPGYDFYSKNEGQTSVWFYLTPKEAQAINSLSNNVFGLDKKPWWRFW